jgi:hypothetical protein
LLDLILRGGLYFSDQQNQKFMNILRRYSATIALASVIILYSCHEDDDVAPNVAAANSKPVNIAKAWHQSKTNSPGFLSLLKADQLVLQPIWKKAEVVELSDGRQVLFAPAKDFEMANEAIEFQRGFLFSLKAGEVTDGKIVEFYSRDHILEGSKFPKRFINQQMAGFSGSVIIYDLLYNRVAGLTYKDGLKVDAKTSIRGKITGNNLRVNTMCYDVYWVTTTGGMEFWDYTYTYCDDPWSGGGGGGGENPGGGGTEPGSYVETPPAEPTVGNDDPNAVPIPDIDFFLRCFSINHPAKITIYVDQPVNGSAIPADGANVGHTWMTIEQNGIFRSVGFYPNGVTNPWAPTEDSQLKDNGGKAWDVSASFDVSADELASLLNFVENQTPSVYDLNSFNCTDFAVEAFGAMGIDLPANESSWPNGGGLCPGRFGEDLRTMDIRIDPKPLVIGGKPEMRRQAPVAVK